MAAELVNSATSEKLVEMDWTKNIQICELVAHDNRYVHQTLPNLCLSLLSLISLSNEEYVRLCVDCGLCLFCWFIVQGFTIESNLWNLFVRVAWGRGIGHCCYFSISSTKLMSFLFDMFNMILIGQVVGT